MSKSTDERNYYRHDRYATIYYGKYPSSKYKYALMHNKSKGGMCFTTDAPLNQGTDICIKVSDEWTNDIGYWDTAGHRATVIWCNEMGDAEISFYGIGVEFYDTLKY